MKNVCFFILIFVVTLSCTKEEPRDCCTIIDTAIDLVFENEAGENILEEENGLAVDAIRLFHKVDEEWVAYFKGNLDYPHGVRLVDEMDQKYLTVFPDLESIKNGKIETKIDYGNGEVDFITSEVEIKRSNHIVTKVHYNGELRWEAADGPRVFTIIK